jgi:hypothetical protein
MRTRHRIPSVFNLSMVDVLCCALGCVILLWLLNLREAKQKSAEAGRSDEKVAELKRDLDAARDRLKDLGDRYAAAQADLSEAQQQVGAARVRLDAAATDARKTAALLDKARAERDEARTRVGRLEKDAAALAAEKASAQEMLAGRNRDVTALEGQVRDRDAAAAAATRRADELAARAKDAEARAKEYRDKFAAEEALAKGLETEINKRMRGQEDVAKSLAAAQRSIAALEEEKKGLIATAERVRAAADNRFAGLQLTGRRVVFLVDMSGSMEYVDEKTEAPEKWSGVRETLSKVMRSLPNLEKYQVILFSDKVSFLFAAEEGWLTYDGTSADRVTAALKAIKPKGGTDMYAAFDAAFRLRGQGLDTIYLLSDGLPNMGEGLTEEQAKRLKETDQAEILGKYVRRKLQHDWNREIRGQGRVRINAIGFFYESPDVGAFLWSLTRENDGGFVGMSKP